MESWNRFRRYGGSNIIFVFVLVQVLCGLLQLLCLANGKWIEPWVMASAPSLTAWIDWVPDAFPYFESTNLKIQLKSFPQLGVLAVGVGLLMIAGEFDLSVGSLFALCAYVMAYVFRLGMPPATAALVALAAGGMIGAINGLIVIKTRIPSFIATLGGMMFWRGALIVFSESKPLSFRPGGVFEDVFAYDNGMIQAPFVWLIVVGILGFLLLERHRFGNHIFAVGGNKETAVAIGVNPNSVKLTCFILVGVLAALAGILSSTRVHSATPIQGAGLELQAIAACVVGGLSLMGGIGSIIGVILGAALLGTISNVLMLLGAPGGYSDMFVGILIVVAVVFNTLTKKAR
jgi:simple sugar transport system permease protein